MARRVLRLRALPVALVALTAPLLAAPAAAAAGAARAAGVCTGAPGCRYALAADLDGDSRPDQVGVVVAASRYPRGTPVSVRVLLATGLRASVTYTTVNGWKRPLLGWALVDSVPGAELLTGSPASPYGSASVPSTTVAPLTLRVAGGRAGLYGLRTPSGETWGVGYFKGLSANGYVCGRSGGRALLTVRRRSLPPPGQHGFVGRDTTYAYDAAHESWTYVREAAATARSESALASIGRVVCPGTYRPALPG